MSRWDDVRNALRDRPRRWLVTGAAGFIGSALVEELLRLGQTVRGMDNLATGHLRNLDDARAAAGPGAGAWEFVRADIRDLDACRAAASGVDVVLHNAALGSVPRSIADPLATHGANIDGFLNMLVATRDAAVPRFVYAASSSTYGDHPGLPKVEDRIGRPLSPYAVTKYVNELYAGVFQRTYGIRTIGLRYFNVFGRRQDPDGPYAAVIPRWVANMLAGRSPVVNGDGSNSRDFCYVDNVVQANLLAATAPDECTDRVYNVAVGERTTLLELYELLRRGLSATSPEVESLRPAFGPTRPGDVPHSLADITLARTQLGYEPTHTVAQGLEAALPWYVHSLAPAQTT